MIPPFPGCRRARRRAWLVALLGSAVLAACGGGADDRDRDATASAAAGLAAPADRARAAAATPGSADPGAAPTAAAAERLFGLAEQRFPELFPAGAASASASPFVYRFYAASGAYLGVVLEAGSPFETGGVYGLGGPFGDSPAWLGRLGDFVAPFAIAAADAQAVVTTGSRVRVAVEVERDAGFDGALTLTLHGLPAGVTHAALTLPPGARRGEIELAAPADAPHSLPTASTLRAQAGDAVAERMLTVTVRGAAGSVDTSFAGGPVATPVGSGEDYARAVAVQPDGRIVVAGTAALPTGTAIAVVRYLRDGSLDAGFGQGGKVVTVVGGRHDSAAAVAVQPDGRIVVAGSTEQPGSGLDFALVRYEPDGRLDAGFGAGGIVVAPIGADTDRAFALALQPDGRIVVGGETQSGTSTTGVDFALARFLPDGRTDPSFGSAGRVVTAVKAANARDTVYALALPVVDGETRILAVGGEGDFVAARYRADGALDAGFGQGGRLAGLFGSNIGAARAVVLRPDGRAVLAGGIGNDFAAAQLTADGALDAGFGSGGRVVHPVSGSGNWDTALALARQDDGRLLLAGWVYAGNSSAGDFAALRLDADGRPDAGFGTGGVVVVPVAAGLRNDQAHGLALQADPRVPTVRAILAGEASAGHHDFALLRLWL